MCIITNIILEGTYMYGIFLNQYLRPQKIPYGKTSKVHCVHVHVPSLCARFTTRKKFLELTTNYQTEVSHSDIMLFYMYFLLYHTHIYLKKTMTAPGKLL